MGARKEAWKAFCEETGAAQVSGGLFRGERIESAFHNWKITIDTYEFTMVTPTVMVMEYTRIRAPFLPTSGFTFHVFKKNLGNKIAEKLGNTYLATGDDAFDREFVVKSDGEDAVKAVLSEQIRGLMLEQTGLNFEISNDKTVLGRQFPKGTSGLSLIVEGEIRDKEKLLSLYHLFGEVLLGLLENGLIESSAVDVELQ